MSWIRLCVWSAGLVVLLGAGRAGAEAPQAAASVTFRFELPGTTVPQYRITVTQDGSLVYEGEETPQLVARQPRVEGAPEAPLKPFRTAASLSSGTAHRIFAMTGRLKQFHANCATKSRNIADTGSKTLQYRGPEGDGECTYNYSDNRTVAELTTLFQGIAETMDEGRKLDELHRYDRLALDQALNELSDQMTAGRALDVETIAGTLRSLASDTELMQRVRVKATHLLDLIPGETAQH
jgi:hypothetical protein